MSLDVSICELFVAKLFITTFVSVIFIFIKSGQYLAIIYRIAGKTSKKVFF
ncbi:hypothetical protein P20480_0757 [Pseudoalteromonas sp. BSi20480]|nr:hypothetical protein P20480_0757 [Pseudoalteromonas sp. BSi20480]